MMTLDDYRTRRPVDEAEVARLAGQMHAQVRAYRLREIRAEQGMTQASVAAQLGVAQNRISELEKGRIERSRLDTLRRYVEALGGHLRIEANFGDASYTIAG
jgi:transcriptional regulator with XRE-family HTH domain